jgi:hypothetical protein
VNKKIIGIISYFPIVAAATTLFVLLIAYVKLGHLPLNKIDPDPQKIGMSWLVDIEVLVNIFDGFLWLAWILLVLIESMRMNRMYLPKKGWIFLLGIAAVMSYRVVVPQSLLWIID